MLGSIYTDQAIYSGFDHSEIEEPVSKMMLPEEVYQQLPRFLADASSVLKSSIEKEVFLLGALTIISGCLPNVYGIYDRRKVGANIYTFIIAPASARKGSLVWAKQLAMPIHLRKREQSEEGKAKMLLIPANNSASGFIEALYNNEERGILFCTEADTLSSAFAQEWGNYDELLRTAYHHEAYAMMRRGNREFSELDRPHLSILLSGTSGQVSKLIPNAENGLFSRFCFYTFDVKPIMKNVFDSDTTDFESHFSNYGKQLKKLHERLEALTTPIQFDFTDQQKTIFFDVFNQWHEEFHLMLGNNSIASIRRLGLIHFRLCMILSLLQYVEADQFPEKVICTDQDFNTAFTIIEVLKEHAAQLFGAMSQGQDGPQLAAEKLRLYNCLPEGEFTRQEALILAAKIKMSRPSLDRFLKSSHFEKVGYGKYKKKLE